MSPVIRCTCGHCGHESYYDGSPDGLGQKILILSTARCSRCDHTGAVITLNIDPPPEARVYRDMPAACGPLA
jgi:hypothetical protein